MLSTPGGSSRHAASLPPGQGAGEVCKDDGAWTKELREVSAEALAEDRSSAMPLRSAQASTSTKRHAGARPETLPDDLWLRVLTQGIGFQPKSLGNPNSLGLREVCSLALCSSRFRALCDSDVIWRALYDSRWPSSGCSVAEQPSDSSWKSKFKKQHEREKMQLLVAHRRKVLRAQSRAEVMRREIAQGAEERQRERERARRIRAEMAHVRQAISTSAAVQVWQPQAVTRKHEHFLEQQTVSPQARLLELEQELQDCLLNARILANSVAKKMEMLKEAEREVAFLTFKPGADMREAPYAVVKHS